LRELFVDECAPLADDLALWGWLGLTRGRWRDKSLLVIEGKHGAEPNLAVSPRRRAPHRAGHACRVIILAIVAFVHLTFAGPNIVTRRRLDCFFARIVAPRL
jgi:hypothetical protein